MQRRDINAADAPPPAGQYTQAVEVTGASRTLYLSGQVGVAADGSIPEDAEAQSRVGVAQSAGATAGCWHGDREFGEDHHDRVQPCRYRLGASRPRSSVGRTSAGEHADHRRSRQPGLEGRGRGHRSRLIALLLRQLDTRPVIEPTPILVLTGRAEFVTEARCQKRRGCGAPSA